MTAVSPVTKSGRQAQVAAILARAAVRSQEELAELLAQCGVRVTQATLSRDLDDLGAVRLRGADGALVYALPGEPGGPGSRPGGLAGGAAAPGREPGREPGRGPGGGGGGGGVAGGPGSPRGGGPGVSPAAVPGGISGGRPGIAQGGAGSLADQAPVESAGGAGRERSVRLARVAAELLVSAEASANLVVLRTPAGGAQLLASAIDHAAWPSILGTVAGDDTVLVITRDTAGGAEVARSLLRAAERRS